MKFIAPLLLLSACSAEGRPDAAGNAAQATALANANQSRGVIVPVQRSDPRGAAAKIMAGGFLPDGSFVHGDHIHKPGQENCPSEMNGGPVQ